VPCPNTSPTVISHYPPEDAPLSHLSRPAAITSIGSTYRHLFRCPAPTPAQLSSPTVCLTPPRCRTSAAPADITSTGPTYHPRSPSKIPTVISHCPPGDTLLPHLSRPVATTSTGLTYRHLYSCAAPTPTQLSSPTVRLTTPSCRTSAAPRP
jgi:hypothetical protein